MVTAGKQRLKFAEIAEEPKKSDKKREKKRRYKFIYNVKYYLRTWTHSGEYVGDYLLADVENFAVSAKQALNNVRFGIDVNENGYLTSQYGSEYSAFYESEYVWIVTNRETQKVEWDTYHDRVKAW